MKAHTYDRSLFEPPVRTVELNASLRLREALPLAARALLALAAALSVVVTTAWLINAADLVLYIQALIWASGFVFLGLALDATSLDSALLKLTTGIALPILAVMSSRVADEIAVIGAAVIAVWIAAGIFRR